MLGYKKIIALKMYVEFISCNFDKTKGPYTVCIHSVESQTKLTSERN